MKEIDNKICLQLQDKAFFVVTSKKFYEKPQDSSYVEEVIKLSDVFDIIGISTSENDYPEELKLTEIYPGIFTGVYRGVECGIDNDTGNWNYSGTLPFPEVSQPRFGSYQNVIIFNSFEDCKRALKKYIDNVYKRREEYAKLSKEMEHKDQN